MERRLEAATAWVVAKIINQRSLLRRHRASHDDSPQARAEVDLALRAMRTSLEAARCAQNVLSLQRHESVAAHRYYQALPYALPVQWKDDFMGRSTRPPRDRVNALLSFGDSLLKRDAIAALTRAGLDPTNGLYHAARAGRASLARDVMQPFRAAWVDSAMLRLLHRGGIRHRDFHVTYSTVMLTDSGRRRAMQAYERRAEEMLTHPRLGARTRMRSLLDLDVRMLAKWMSGDAPDLRPFSRH